MADNNSPPPPVEKWPIIIIADGKARSIVECMENNGALPRAGYTKQLLATLMTPPPKIEVNTTDARQIRPGGEVVWALVK